MGFFDKIKNVFSSDDNKNFSKENFQRNINKLVSDELDYVNKLMKLGIEAKRKGRFEKALSYYNQVEEKTMGINPKLASAKGKILIILDRVNDAQHEFLKCIIWFKENIHMIEEFDSTLRGNCMGAIEHIGYCIEAGKWNDEDSYLNSLAGKGGRIDERETIKRLAFGFFFIEEYGIWCREFEILKLRVLG